VLAGVRDSWRGDLSDPAFRTACAAAMAAHASTRERVPFLETFYAGIWRHTGVPRRMLDVGCGLSPLALPWMGLDRDARYIATDVDRRPLAAVDEFLALVGQAHVVRASDAVTDRPSDAVDVALLLKLVPTLDRQDPGAASHLIDAIRARHAVVSFPARSLGGRSKGMERAYRARLDDLAARARVTQVAEASVPNELVFVLTLDG
jgi:16S rRNA (guanine(1405)-N(7))-methyltransferase